MQQELIHNIAKLQKDWNKLKQTPRMSIDNIKEICIPFRDKYNLSDRETLGIARDEFSFEELDAIFNKEGDA